MGTARNAGAPGILIAFGVGLIVVGVAFAANVRGWSNRILDTRFRPRPPLDSLVMLRLFFGVGTVVMGLIVLLVGLASL